MKISKIIIKNYRSLQDVEVAPTDFSIFVGQNNHGKTNFFEAIEWFYNSKKSKKNEHFGCDEENEISVELFYADIQKEDIEKIKTETNKTKIYNLLDGHSNFSIKKTSSDFKRVYIVDQKENKNPSGLDTAINEFLPKIEYINTKIRLEDISSYKARNPIGTMLSGVLSLIIEESEEYKDFKEKFIGVFEGQDSEIRKELNKLGKKVEKYLQRQFPDNCSVRFTVSTPQLSDLLKNFETIIDDGIETKAEDKGDGMQRAIMLSIIQAFADYRKEKAGGGSFLFLIDEAELHLHPSAQRALKKALIQICESDQVFINTHSSVLVVEKHGLQTIFKVEKTKEGSRINKVKDEERVDVIFDLLGGSPADILLPRNFIIVEGRSEYFFLKKIIERFYPSQFYGFRILFAGGDIKRQKSIYQAINSLLMPLTEKENQVYREKAIIVLDKPNHDQKSSYEQFKKGYPYLFSNDQVFTLPVESIEEYYPGEYKKEKKEISNKEKVEYAIYVAENITKEEFENDMVMLYKSLCSANEKGF